MIESAQEFIRLRTSRDPAEYGRAASEGAADEVWEELIDGHPDMRFWVADNRQVPPAFVHRLASDPDARVRGRVARRRALAEGTIRLLARDQSDAVRLSIAAHRRTPDDVLRDLAHDPWSVVADRARSRLSG